MQSVFFVKKKNSIRNIFDLNRIILTCLKRKQEKFREIFLWIRRFGIRENMLEHILGIRLWVFSTSWRRFQNCNTSSHGQFESDNNAISRIFNSQFPIPNFFGLIIDCMYYFLGIRLWVFTTSWRRFQNCDTSSHGPAHYGIEWCGY